MQDIVVNLKCEMGKSFRCQKAADSVSLDTDTKSEHNLKITAPDLEKFNVGVIVGSSGSGKTTLAKRIWGEGFEKTYLDLSRPVIDQFPDDWTYDDCAQALTGMGLTSIPCWIRPAYTLSNGQRARAEAALGLALCPEGEIFVIDEWTSVVDRTAAKIMSHRIQKEVRRKNLRVVLLSCHYDILDWVNPDWVIDCNLQTFKDRRNGEVEAHERQDNLRLTVEPCDLKSWKYFSKYHYLNENLAPDTRFAFGLFEGKNQIGFVAFTRYAFKNQKMLHSNRVVVHPDYVGLGLGIRMVDAASEYLSSRGYEIRAKFTSIAMLKARLKDPKWAMIKKEKILSQTQGAVGAVKTQGKAIRSDQIKGRNAAKSFYVTYYTFRWKGAP